MSSLLDSKRTFKQYLVYVHESRAAVIENIAQNMNMTGSAFIEFILNYSEVNLSEEFEHAFVSYWRDRQFRKCYSVRVAQQKRWDKFHENRKRHPSVIKRRKETG